MGGGWDRPEAADLDKPIAIYVYGLIYNCTFKTTWKEFMIVKAESYIFYPLHVAIP